MQCNKKYFGVILLGGGGSHGITIFAGSSLKPNETNLLKGLQKTLSACTEWRLKVDRLESLNRHLTPIRARLKPLSQPMEGRLLCNLSLGEKKCWQGDRLAVIDNRSVNWIVKLEKFDGSVAEVPSLMIQLVGIDDDARGRCLSIRKKFERLWTNCVIEWSRLFLRFLNGAHLESTTREDKQRHLEFIRVAKNEISLVEQGEEFHEIFDKLNKAVRNDKKFSDLEELNRILTTFKAFISQWKVYVEESSESSKGEINLIESPKIEYIGENPIEQKSDSSYITTSTKLEENRQTITRRTIYSEIDRRNGNDPIKDQSPLNNNYESEVQSDLSDSLKPNNLGSSECINFDSFDPISGEIEKLENENEETIEQIKVQDKNLKEKKEQGDEREVGDNSNNNKPKEKDKCSSIKEEDFVKTSLQTVSSNPSPDTFANNSISITNNKKATVKKEDKRFCKADTNNGDRTLSVLYLDGVDSNVGKISEGDKIPYQRSELKEKEIKVCDSNAKEETCVKEKQQPLFFGQIHRETVDQESTSSLKTIGAETKTTVESVQLVRKLGTAVVAETNQLVSAEKEETSKFVITAVIHPRTRRRITLKQACEEGIIRNDLGVYFDKTKGKSIPIAEAMNSGLIIVENVTKEVGKEKYHDMGLITIQDGKGQTMTFAIRSIVDERLNKKVSFNEAIKNGILNKEKGVYKLNKTNQELELQEAVKKGYVKAQIVDNPSSLEGIHPHNVVVVEKVSAIKKKILKPMAVVNSMKKSVDDSKN